MHKLYKFHAAGNSFSLKFAVIVSLVKKHYFADLRLQNYLDNKNCVEIARRY